MVHICNVLTLSLSHNMPVMSSQRAMNYLNCCSNLMATISHVSGLLFGLWHNSNELFHKSHCTSGRAQTSLQVFVCPVYFRPCLTEQCRRRTLRKEEALAWLVSKNVVSNAILLEWDQQKNKARCVNGDRSCYSLIVIKAGWSNSPLGISNALLAFGSKGNMQAAKPR